MLHLLLAFIVIGMTSISPVAAQNIDFTPKDDSESLEMDSTPDDDSTMMGDAEISSSIEAEQPEIRVTRGRAVGLRLGESLPHTSIGVIYQRFLSDTGAASATLSRGEFRSAEQSDGEAWIENRAKTWLMAARYLWWPNPNFPFSVSADASIESAVGTLTSRAGANGSYRAETLYLSSGLVMSHIFSSGIWLEWTLISINYGKNLRGQFENATGQQMEKVRKNLNGLKVLGFANLSVGYTM